MEKIYSCTVEPSVIKRAQFDADAYHEQNAKKYAQRNQFNAKKINQDMATGLSFELGSAYPYLCENFGEDLVEEPYVYDGTNEMKEDFKHDPDIVVHGGLKFHCKSISPYTAKTFGYGWLFQKNYLERNDKKLRESDTDYVVFGTMDIDTGASEILIVQQFKVLFENNMFEIPVKRGLRDGKRVIKYSKFIEKDIPKQIEIKNILDTMTETKEVL
jgi:hypothetical protein